jgi:hypothetical protein
MISFFIGIVGLAPISALVSDVQDSVNPTGTHLTNGSDIPYISINKNPLKQLLRLSFYTPKSNRLQHSSGKIA